MIVLLQNVHASLGCFVTDCLSRPEAGRVRRSDWLARGPGGQREEILEVMEVGQSYLTLVILCHTCGCGTVR